MSAQIMKIQHRSIAEYLRTNFTRLNIYNVATLRMIECINKTFENAVAPNSQDDHIALAFRAMKRRSLTSDESNDLGGLAKLYDCTLYHYLNKVRTSGPNDQVHRYLSRYLALTDEIAQCRAAGHYSTVKAAEFKAHIGEHLDGTVLSRDKEFWLDYTNTIYQDQAMREVRRIHATFKHLYEALMATL